MHGFTTLVMVVSSYSRLLVFFSAASTTPVLLLMPIEGAPAATAAIAYSIWTSLPEGEKVVRLKLYRSDMLARWRERVREVTGETNGHDFNWG